LGSILVLYHAPHLPLRRTVSDHLNSIRRYSGRPCIYINLARRQIPRWIDRLQIDLVVLHTILLSTRWEHDLFMEMTQRMQPIKKLSCPVIAIPQDEFLNTDPLNDLLREFRVSHVFTCAAEPDWEAIYGPLIADGVRLTRVLTGYVEPATVERIEKLARRGIRRDIDIGYRSWQPEPWLGRHGMLKGQIAEAFAKAAPSRGLNVDISMHHMQTLLGDAWYAFLLRCRYTIGVEGGASIHDRDGSIRRCVDATLASNPSASFEEIEATCFPGLDGRFGLRAISPRHLEAAATRTPQILIEGEYNGILEAERHYIPLKADFGNIGDVLDEVAGGRMGSTVAQRAYDEVIASGRYGYDSFVRTLLTAVPDRAGRESPSFAIRGLAAWDRATNAPAWKRFMMRETLRRVGLLSFARRARATLRRRLLHQGAE
jgi:hypothetical protein